MARQACCSVLGKTPRFPLTAPVGRIEPDDDLCPPSPPPVFSLETFYSVLFEIAPTVEEMFTRSKRVQGQVGAIVTLIVYGVYLLSWEGRRRRDRVFFVYLCVCALGHSTRQRRERGGGGKGNRERFCKVHALTRTSHRWPANGWTSITSLYKSVVFLPRDSCLSLWSQHY